MNQPLEERINYHEHESLKIERLLRKSLYEITDENGRPSLWDRDEERLPDSIGIAKESHLMAILTYAEDGRILDNWTLNVYGETYLEEAKKLVNSLLDLFRGTSVDIELKKLDVRYRPSNSPGW